MNDDFESYLSDLAKNQIDALERDAYNATLDAIELIVREPDRAQRLSVVIRTDVGMRFQLPVVGAEPMKVFWSRNNHGPRVEAVFPYSRT